MNVTYSEFLKTDPLKFQLLMESILKKISSVTAKILQRAINYFWRLPNLHRLYAELSIVQFYCNLLFSGRNKYTS